MGSVIDSAIKIGSYGLVDTDISGKKAGENALNAQTNAAREANANSAAALVKQQEELQPWKDAGLKALERIQSGNLTMDPGYQFRLNEGNKAINAAASARGRYDSGRALKELTRYGQDYASGEYQNAFNRDNAIANYGNNASNNIANFQGGFGALQAQNAIGLGNANAANSIGQATRDAGMVGQGIGLAGMAFGNYGGAGKMGTTAASGGGGPIGGNPYSLGNPGINQSYLANGWGGR